ncbi:MAG: SHOCT domain-containing protein [Halobacteriota archaeon]|uniref:SHOCT domain-containing protein n=1 Tax=Natronomonas sp. TaxID=2184060 RepID=UPI003974AE15
MTDADRLDELADTADGDSVTTEVLRREINGQPLHELLEDAERPQYFLTGSMLDIVDESAPESDPGRRRRKVASSGTSLSTVVTDRRLLVLLPRTDDIERLSVPFSDVVAVNAENAPGGNHRLSVRTGDKSYRIDTSQTESAETDSASQYIDATELTGERTHRDAAGGVTESLDALERLADLYDRGAITDREFEEMKAKILE